MDITRYFDSAASTPLDERVKAEMLKYMDVFGNNNSKHVAGFAAQKIIDQSLQTIAKILGCKSDHLAVVYSGTDANRRAIYECQKRFGSENLWCSAVEHSSVSDEILPQNRFNPRTLEKLPKNATLACLMGANSETGSLYSAKDLRENFSKTLILRDYSQSFAKWVFPDLENCDFGVFTPQKFYGPKHIGILYLKDPQNFKEISKDSHTKNCWLVAGAAKAFSIWEKEGQTNKALLAAWDQQICQFIRQNISDHKFHETPENRVVGVINVAFRGVRGSELMAVLSGSEEICVSTGSACTTDLMSPTTVIRYLEKDPIWQYPVRISLHTFLTDESVDEFCEILAHYVGEMRRR